MTEPTTTTPLPRTALPKAYVPSEVEGRVYERWLAADVFPPDGPARPPIRPAAVHDHPAAPEHHRVAPPRPRPADRGRGPDDPARADARASDAVPARPRPRVDRGPVRARRDPRHGGRDPGVARPRALPRADGRVPSTKPVMLGQQRRVGASADWGRLRYTMDEGSAEAVRVAFERLYGDGLAYRTEALINWCPGCRTSVSDLEVIPTPETGTLWFVRYHLIDEATGKPDRTRRSRSPRRGRRRSSATPRSRCTPTTSATATSSGAACGSRSSSGTCRSSRTRSSSGSSGRARSRSRPPTTTRTTRPAGATACR